MTKLTETQSTLLAAAATRDDLALLPAPAGVRARGAALDRALRALLARGLVAEAPVTAEPTAWRSGDGGARIGLVVTPAGLDAIGVDPEPAPDRAPDEEVSGAREPAEPVSRPGGKLGKIVDAVGGEAGATLDELVDATGWQAHTTRAALTRLRQRGFAIRLETADGRKAYRLADTAA